MKPLLAATALLLLPLQLTAQDPETAGPTGPSRRAPRPDPVAVSLEFGGGTLAEFVAAVRARQPQANIVLAERARGARIPSLVLKDAGLEQALEGACMAADAGYDVRVREFKGSGSQPVYSIVAQVRQGPGQVQGGFDGGLEVQNVLSLNHLIKETANGVPPLKVETVLSALELAMADEDKAPRIRYHEDSGLLLVRATPQQARLVDDILRTLSRDRQEEDQRAMQRRILQQQEAAQEAARQGGGGQVKDR